MQALSASKEAGMADMAGDGDRRSKGGFARAEVLPAEERSRIASHAARARWQYPTAEYAGELKLSSMEFPCAVLSDGTRVLTESDFMAGMGMYRSGALSIRREAGTESHTQVPLYLAFKNLIPFVVQHLGDTHIKPLKYRTLTGGVAHGISASIIPKICAVWLDARRAGVLGQRQLQIADRAEILLRGLAEVGIIALVDEATGYQRVRAADALARILEAFVAKELQPWVKKFPTDFYEQMFRLRGLPFPPASSVRRPQYFGHLTNDVIYRRLAPGVWKELKAKVEKDESGRPKHKLHQHLTPEIGDPRLRDLITSVTTIMKLSDGWADFKVKLNRIHQPFNETMPLPLEIAEDTGQGL
jgi:P63C domain